MRKTSIQLLLLMLVGAIIFWREWATNFSIGQQVGIGSDKTISSVALDSSPNTIIWLVVVAGVLWLLTEVGTRYLKLSSPNSV